MGIFIISFLSSTIVSSLLIRYSHWHIHITADPLNGEPQKFHNHPVPRVGGIAVAIGLLMAGIVMFFQRMLNFRDYIFLLISAMPAFAGGIIEDLTKKAGIKLRLIMTMLSGGVGIFLLNALITRSDIPFIDAFISLSYNFNILHFEDIHLISYLLSAASYTFTFAFTIFAVAGIANAINIIDGLNGLAGMVSLTIILALGYISCISGDNSLMLICVAVGGAILGFLLWNYPSGMIFLGDGGAYLLGFLIAEISILLVNRLSEVSAWFPMVLVAYPVTETLFSIYRRKFLKKLSPGMPDALHLHTLLYRRIFKGYKRGRNSVVTPYIWVVVLITTLLAIVFYQRSIILIFLLIAFISFYVWLYWRIVRFKTPRWLIKIVRIKLFI